MPKKRLTYHPACRLFPRLSEQELQTLADDIKTRGLLNPIVLYQGKVLDGRNRLAACRIAKVEPRFVEWDGDGSPVEWVIATNLLRRHLTSSQRAVVALDLLPLLEKEAKERQRFSRSSSAKKCADESKGGKASEVAARITRTNSRYVEAVKAIRQKAPELVGMIRSGAVKVPEAVGIADLPPKRRATVIQRIEKGGSANGKGNYGFRRGDYTDNSRPSTIYTPPGICRFLYDTISPVYNIKTILDPCAGQGALTRPWKDAEVVSFEIERGKDFLAHDGRIRCDLVLCNPPFNNEGGEGRGFLPERFLAKTLDVAGPKARIVLFTPMGMRLNQHRSSERWRWLRDETPQITSIISLALDVFDGVEFHSEILLFNMPKLKPHYFLPDKYLPRHPRRKRERGEQQTP